jgi:hypothetical protein
MISAETFPSKAVIRGGFPRAVARSSDAGFRPLGPVRERRKRVRSGVKMAKGQSTRRQKDISRLLREKKRIPPPEKFGKGKKDKKK